MKPLPTAAAGGDPNPAVPSIPLLPFALWTPASRWHCVHSFVTAACALRSYEDTTLSFLLLLQDSQYSLEHSLGLSQLLHEFLESFQVYLVTHLVYLLHTTPGCPNFYVGLEGYVEVDVVPELAHQAIGFFHNSTQHTSYLSDLTRWAFEYD